MNRTVFAIFSLILSVFSATYARDIPPTQFPEAMASGTLPLISIHTENLQPVTSKDKDSALVAEMNIIVPQGYKNYQRRDSVFSVSGLPLTIRGRGNRSWQSDVKPYKIKFDKKQAILGMPKNKHYALLPLAGYLNYLAEFAGLEAARLFPDWYVPRIEPIELAINGQYEGRYFLVETIRIDKHRLDIFEQSDLCTASDTIPYGWLVEVDNNPQENSFVSVPEKLGLDLNVTYHKPEILCEQQHRWLTQEFRKLNDAVYRGDDSWTERIDPASAARYFIIRELLWDPDGYAGSMYLYRDLDRKWKFGPLWDLASTHQHKDAWVFDSSRHYGVHWFFGTHKIPGFQRCG